MVRNIYFEHKERVWEQSNFGFLVRLNAYYTLYPYIFGFHDPQSFKMAQIYAAYDAHNYFLKFTPDDFINDQEGLAFWEQLLSCNSETVREWQEVNKDTAAVNQAIWRGPSPDKPKFFHCLIRDAIKYKKRKFKGVKGASEYQFAEAFEPCEREKAIFQRDITYVFCYITNVLHVLQQNPTLLDSSKMLPPNISKTMVFKLVVSSGLVPRVSMDKVEEYVNWHAPIAPLIYAMSSCVDFDYSMRDDFISNLSLIVARNAEIYNVVVNEAFHSAQESCFTTAKVYALDLPLPESIIPLPPPRIPQTLLDLIRPLLK